MQESLNIDIWQDYIQTLVALVFAGQLNLLKVYDSFQTTITSQFYTYLDGLQQFQPNKPHRIELPEYSDVYLQSPRGNVCELLTKDPELYLSLFAELNADWASLGVPKRQIRYQTAKSIPNFQNPQNLTGDAYQLAIFTYYCSNLGGGVATNGMVQMYNYLQQFAANVWSFVDLNENDWSYPSTFAIKLAAFQKTYSNSPVNEAFGMQVELQDLLILLTQRNNDYCFKYLNNAQTYLFVFGVTVIILIFIIGGELLVQHLHQELYTTKRTISIISYDQLKENPYLNNYLTKNMKTQ